MTIVEFLTARLDEDEATARRTVQYGYDSDGPNGVLAAAGRLGREVEAKRRIVEGAEAIGRMRPYVANMYVIASDVLRALASVYSHHPDYRKAWKP